MGLLCFVKLRLSRSERKSTAGSLPCHNPRNRTMDGAKGLADERAHWTLWQPRSKLSRKQGDREYRQKFIWDIHLLEA